jgi:hypothetical protein
MTTVCCPICHEQVSIPSGVASQVQVRCPLCQEQYRLVEALKELPPLLIVVPESQPNSQHVPILSATDEMPEVEPHEESLDEYTVESKDAWPSEEFQKPSRDSHEVATETPPGPSVFDNWGQVQPAQEPRNRELHERAPAASGSRSSSASSRHRHRRKKAGPIRSFVQIVGGGLLGLVIAQLILWWMPGNWARDKRDPLGIADPVSAYAPFLVPAEVRGAKTTATNSGAGQHLATETSPKKSLAKEARYGMPGQENATEPSSAPAENRDDVSQPAQGDEKNQATAATHPNDSEMKNRFDQVPEGNLVVTGAGRDPKGGSIDTNNEASEPNDNKRETDGAPSNSTVAATPIEIRNYPKFDGQQVAMLLSSALRAEEAWDKGASAPLEERRQQWKDFYGSFAKLGESLAFVDRNDPAFIEQLPNIQSTVDGLATKPDKLVNIAAYAALLIKEERKKLENVAADVGSGKNQKRDHDGILLFGTVVDYQTNGRVQEMKINLVSTQGDVQLVVLRPASAEPLRVNSRVLVLGKLITEPGPNIGGYDGSESLAAYEGYSVSLPGG